jgi:hypothetical protein
VVRDSSYLNWRFSDCPTPYTIWLALRNGQTAGFLVTSRERATPTAAIVDLFAESNDADTVRALLATGIAALLNEGVQLINSWSLRGSAQSAAHVLLRRALPFRRKPQLHLAFKILRPEKAALPLPSQKWHFTLGDCDGA